MSPKAVVNEAVAIALNEVARNPTNGLTPHDVPSVTDAVVKKVAPVVLHVANQEPWYQSRVTWGALVGIAAGIAGIAGYTVGPEDQAAIVTGIVSIASGIGGLIALYGRYRAKKPLGS